MDRIDNESQLLYRGKKLNRVQFEIMINRMRQNPDMAEGIVVKDNRARVKKFWKQLSEELNRAGPPEKTISEWRKAWTDRRRYERQRAPLNSSFTKSFDEESNEQTHDIPVVNIPLEPTEINNKYSDSTNSLYAVKECYSISSNQSFPEQFTPFQAQVHYDADDSLPQKNENTDSTQIFFKRLHLTLENMYYQKQLELDETKRHNMQMEMLEQEKIALKTRSLQIKEENLRLLRQSMTSKYKQ